MVLWSIKKAINIFLKNGERNKICMVIPLSTFAKRNRISFFCQRHRCTRTFISIWIQTQNVGKHIRLYPSNSLCVIQHIFKNKKACKKHRIHCTVHGHTTISCSFYVSHPNIQNVFSLIYWLK